MARTYLVRGMVAGLLAGLCAIAFAKLVAEPQIARAERFEGSHQPALVSRDVQDTVGLGTGVAVAGVALGGLFGLAFAAVYRRWSRTGANVTAVLLAVGAFAAVFLVPFLKYPANPPSVGNPDTIGRRTALYLIAVAVGLLSVVLGVVVRRRALARLGPWNAALAGVASTVAAVATSFVLLPGIDEVPAGFPASVLWKFRLASAGTELVLWAAMGLVFGALTERSEARVA
jgi:predicted cobalt transporter CbtA